MTPSLFTPAELAHLIQLVESNAPTDNRRGGVRDIMWRVPELRAVADDAAVRSIVEQVLGPDALVVRSTLFDKTGTSNWKVPWHQDLTIAARGRVDTPGYGPWSIKGGVAHVQPPSHVLQRMVTVRVHLDDCPASNGALRVMPGSHHLGRIDQNNTHSHVTEGHAVTCEALAGEALVMRPLLLHSSSASSNPRHRRVLHFDFAAGNLATGMRWNGC